MRRLILILAVAMLAACSRDPNKQKLKYLNSGANYFKAGKFQEAAIQFRNAVQIDPRLAEGHYQLARAYLSLKNSEAAYREFLESTTLDPKNSDAQLQLASLQIARRQYAQAQAAAERVLAMDPKNVRAHAILGGKYAATSDLTNAIVELKKAVELDPYEIENYVILGAVYLTAGQPSEAEATCKRAVEANPKSPDARMALGQFYFSQHRMAEAEAATRTAAELDPRAVFPRLFLARIYLATGKPSDAEILYKQLKTIAADDPQAYQALGIFYASTGQKEKAAIEFRALSNSKPNDSKVKMLLIDTLIDLGKIQEAKAVNQELIKVNAGGPQGSMVEGRILIVQGKYEQAAAEFQKALHADPKSAVSYYYLGVAQNLLGFPSQAKSSWVRALELAPQLTEAQLALADLDANTGNYDEALRLTEASLNSNLLLAHLIRAKVLLAKGDTKGGEAELQTVLARDPASLPALTMLVNLRIRESRPQEVLPRISKLVEQYPQNAGLRFLLAGVYFRLNELGNAEANAARAVMLDRQTPDGYTLLANIHKAQGSVEKAKGDLQAAIDVNPRTLANYMTLEKLYESEADWAGAKKLLERARQVDRDSPVVANSLAYLYLEHGGDVNLAMSLAQEARQKMPHSPKTADTLGWAYYKLGSPELAIAELKDCAQQAPNDPMCQYHLGMAYIAGRHFDSAEQSLQKALRADPNFSYAATAREALDKISRSPH